jgi:hypothetical protein
MNTFSRKKLLFLIPGLALAGLGFVTPRAEAVANPSSVKVKIYEMRVSKAANCSNSITIFSNPSGTTQDMVSNPTLGAGAIPNGTYQCIMVKIDNQITYIPATTDGACIQGNSFIRNIFRSGSTSIDPNGNTIQGVGSSSSDPAETAFWAYFAIGGAPSSNGNSCATPASPCTLTNAVVVSGDKTGTLVTDFDGQIDGISSPGTCDLKPCAFSYR